jgi:hypothetical protein
VFPLTASKYFGATDTSTYLDQFNDVRFAYFSLNQLKQTEEGYQYAQVGLYDGLTNRIRYT